LKKKLFEVHSVGNLTEILPGVVPGLVK